MKKIFLLAGARPNYMKVFPLARALKRAGGFDTKLVHTGQHYDAAMSDRFFDDFGVPPPDFFLGVGSGPHGAQTARVMLALEPLLAEHRPDWLIVVGDVNSTVAGALVAVKLGLPTAHLEAGLRSGDRTMPEEINRIVTDSISDLLLTSCRDADENLLREGVPADRIRFVGNIMIDSLVEMLPRAATSRVLESLSLDPGHYVCVTLHRPSNVDHPEQLRPLVAALERIAHRVPVVFPVHPRTRGMLDRIESLPPALKMIEPLGYLDFLRLQSQAALVITDSGGVQEETSYLGIPCLTVRPNTERPITITQGTNRLVLPGRDDLAHAAEEALGAPARSRPSIEYWDGRTAERVVACL